MHLLLLIRAEGVITFDFSLSAEIVYAIGFLDIKRYNNTNISVVHFDQHGALATTLIVVDPLGNNSVQNVAINIKSVLQLRVNFGSSGAVTFISYCVTPDGGSRAPVLTTPAPSQVPSRSPAPSGLPSDVPSGSQSVSLSRSRSASPSLPSLYNEVYVVVIIVFSVLPDGCATASGVYVSTEWLEVGLSLSASGGCSSFPRLLETSDVSDNLNLGSPNAKCNPPGPGVGNGGEPGALGENCDSLGNVLIVQEGDTELSVPNRNGGTITCDFSRNISMINSIGLMGIEGNSTTITVIHHERARSTTISVIGLGRNSVQTVFVEIEHVSQLSVNLSGPGAVTSIAIGTYRGDEPESPAPTPMATTILDGNVALSDSLVLITNSFDMLPDGSPAKSGSYVSSEWSDEVGFKLSASGGHSSSPRLFNTLDINTGNILGSPNEECSSPGPGAGAGGRPTMKGANCEPLGNVLIIQSNDTGILDASSEGGVITFEFFPIVPLVHSIGLMGIIGNRTTITVVNEDRTQTTEISVVGLGINSVQTIDIGLKRVSKLSVHLLGIAAVTEISLGKDPSEVIRQKDGTDMPSPLPSSPPPSLVTSAARESPTSFSSSNIQSQVLSVSSVHRSALAATSDNCHDVMIDFDTLPDGSPLSGGWWCDYEWFDEYGLILSASGGHLDIPRLLSTSDVPNVNYASLAHGSPNEKCDLSGPGIGEGGEPGMQGENCVPQGNVLIIMPEDVDDSVTDGIITFDFQQSMHFVREIGLMDIHGNDTRVSVVHDNGVEMDTTVIHISGQGANSVQTVPINLRDVSRLKVHLPQTGAVTFISFCFHPANSPSEIPAVPNESPVPSMFPSRSPSLLTGRRDLEKRVDREPAQENE